MVTEMTEDRLREIERHWSGDRWNVPIDYQEAVRAAIDTLIAALRQAWQERDIEAKAALACNDALVRERAALATAQAEIARLQQCPPEATGYWPDHIRAIAEQRDAAQAERDALRTERDALQEEREVENRRHCEVCTELVTSREHLTEARRVLRLVDKQARRECPVCFSPGWTHKEGCALAAVLAQEGQ